MPTSPAAEAIVTTWPLLREHAGEERTGRPEEREDVDVERELDFLGEASAGSSGHDAGVVDQDVDRTAGEHACRRGFDGLARREVADVALDFPAGRLELAPRRFESRRVHVPQDDLRPAGRELPRHEEPETARGTGDDDPPSGDLAHRVRPRGLRPDSC
jgi:hypothetical protein